MKIAHVSDVHIRLKDRHEEYREVFDRLYEELKKQKPDRILLGGDIVHSKITLSPELVSLTVDFFTKLQMIAPVDMIVGNHDMNMSNMDRMDALTPIVEASSHPDTNGHGITYYLESGIHEFAPGFSYGVWSLLDGQDVHLKKSSKKDGHVYIGLFHGVVAGCVLDNEYVMSDASTSIETFDGFDFVMLGDIHRMQFMDSRQTIAYPGSLIQQNFGEDLDHGFLMWDIKSRDDFTCEFVKVANDHAFYTIYADDGELPDIELPSKTRIRVVWAMESKDISRSEANRINSLIRAKYDPISLQLTFKPITVDGSFGDVEIGEGSNLTDPIVQEDLLKQWFTRLDEDVDMDALMTINTQVTDTVTSSEFEDFTNSRWVLKSVTMDHFMSYGDQVKIDFDEMRGVVGLFGDNTAGKSVIIDAILYTLFNKTTRGVKNEDLVNKNSGVDVCTVKLELEIKGVDYIIERWTTRQYKADGEFKNARTDVTFMRRYGGDIEWENLTETQRTETEVMIRNAIGSYDDFIITTLSTQDGASEFTTLKASPRADTMLRFLGLDIFNKKYDYAKGLLKSVEAERKVFNSEHEFELLDTKKKKLKAKKKDRTAVNKKIKGADGVIDKIRSDIMLHSNEINQTIKIEKDKDTLQGEWWDLSAEIDSLETKKAGISTVAQALIDKMAEFEKAFILDEDKILELVELKEEGDVSKRIIKTNREAITTNKRILKVFKADMDSANECPVKDDTRHTTCKFLKGYMGKKKECMDLIAEVDALQKEMNTHMNTLTMVDYVYKALDEQEIIRESLQAAVAKLDGLKQDIEACDNKLEVNAVSLQLIKSQLKIAENNEETIKNNIHHRAEVGKLEGKLKVETKSKAGLDKEKDELVEEITILTKEISDIEGTLEKIRKSDNQHHLFSLYCEAMHRKGLPIEVLRTYIPKINYEINSILSDVVDFGVYLKIEDDATDIEIVMRSDGDGDDTRPVSMASGMEKLLINMAIRYALLSISNLNTSSTWFIDEGFGVLDAENLYSMSRFFDNVKGVFKNIVIITHIDSLKDIADWVINIEKKGGISLVNSPVKNI